jgi:anti-sigma regulatory factor (Ser/Thr protein kinase)
MALNQAFDADTLHTLREAVLAEATAAGMDRDRAADVMIAVNELAANAVRHGAGGGQLRMRIEAGQLHCRVSDAGAGLPGGDARWFAMTAEPWPFETGHGLWLVRRLADQVSVITGSDGTEATAVFTLPVIEAGMYG